MQKSWTLAVERAAILCSLKKVGLNVIGLDLSKRLLGVARHKFPDITFVEGNLLNLPFEDASFDGIWSNTSLLHLEAVDDVRKSLAEMNRVLKPSGVLHVVVKAQTSNQKTAVVSDKLSGQDRFFQYFTINELSKLVEESSFKLINIKEYSEIETIPHGRPEVRIIWALARKN